MKVTKATATTLLASVIAASVSLATPTQATPQETPQPEPLAGSIVPHKPSPQAKKVVKKIRARTVATPAKLGIVDKSGYRNDKVVLPKNTRQVTYKVSYLRRTGAYTFTATAGRGYIFSTGKTVQVTKGKLNVTTPKPQGPQAPITKIDTRAPSKPFTSCKDMVSRWRPAQLPKGLKVRCEDNPQVLVGHEMTPVDGYVQPEWCDKYWDKRGADLTYCGISEIVIRDKMRSSDNLRETYNHEAWHAYSFYWKSQTQERFWKTLGVNDWDDGISYFNYPSERWAWAATSCFAAPSSIWRDSFYESLMPGRCAAVRQWVNNTWSEVF